MTAPQRREGRLPAGLTFRQEPRPADVEPVGRLASSSGFFYPAEVAVAVELIEERLAKGLRSGYHFIFADLAGRPAAYSCFGPIACTEVSFDLYWIVVDEDLRGRGLGRELLARTEAAVAALGGRRIYVETSARPQYQPTRSFYENVGYRLEAALRDFYAPGDDKLIYLKVLPEPQPTRPTAG